MCRWTGLGRMTTKFLFLFFPPCNYHNWPKELKKQLFRLDQVIFFFFFVLGRGDYGHGALSLTRSNSRPYICTYFWSPYDCHFDYGLGYIFFFGRDLGCIGPSDLMYSTSLFEKLGFIIRPSFFFRPLTWPH